MGKTRSLILNRLLSAGSGFLFTFYVGFTLFGNYVDFVSVSSLVLMVTAFTFQWTLHNIVLSSSDTLQRSLDKFSGNILPITFITIAIYTAAYILYDDSIGFDGLLLGIGYSLYVVSNEAINHISTKLSSVKAQMSVSSVRVLAIGLFLTLPDSKIITVAILSIILSVVNFAALFHIFSTINCRVSWCSRLMIQRDEIHRAVGLFVAGITLQLERLVAPTVPNTISNSLLYMVSDYSNIILGFVLSIFYWKFGSVYFDIFRTITKNLIRLYVSLLVILLISCLMFFDYDYADIVPVYVNVLSFASILISVFAVLSKTYFVDPLLMSISKSNIIIVSNVCIILAFVFSTFGLNAYGAYNFIMIKSVVVTLVSLVVLLITRIAYVAGKIE